MQKLSRRAANAIRELREEHGIEPTLDEIIWLHELGREIENPTEERLDLIGMPVKVGNDYLWRFTVMAAAWWNEYAVRWFVDQPLLQMYALAFALAHGRGKPIPDTKKRGWLERIIRKLLDIHETRVLAELVDQDEARKAVLKWARSLGCTKDELFAAIDVVNDNNDNDTITDEEINHSPIDTEALVQEIAIRTGMEADYWRKQPREYVTRALHRAFAIDAARAGQGMDANPLKIQTIAAHQRERAAIVAIIEAHKEDKENEEKEE